MPLHFNATVHTPMYEYNDKKYIRFIVPDATVRRIEYFHAGNVLTIKVPFRYRRVMCKYEGAPVQSLNKGDDVEVDTDFMGCWNVGEYSGYSWKLSYIKLVHANTV
jgi:hypothetical protein